MGSTIDSSGGWVALDAEGASIEIVGMLEYESSDYIEVEEDGKNRKYRLARL
jgi:hypothetical protein